MTNALTNAIILFRNAFEKTLNIIDRNTIPLNSGQNLFHQSCFEQTHIPIFQQNIDICNNILRRIQILDGIVKYHFVFRSERELGGGYADICLEPHLQRYAGIRHGYVIELKYLARRDDAGAARVEQAAGEAAAQLRRYLADERLKRQYRTVRFTGLALVFHGWELVRGDAVTETTAVETATRLLSR